MQGWSLGRWILSFPPSTLLSHGINLNLIFGRRWRLSIPFSVAWRPLKNKGDQIELFGFIALGTIFLHLFWVAICRIISGNYATLTRNYAKSDGFDRLPKPDIFQDNSFPHKQLATVRFIHNTITRRGTKRQSFSKWNFFFLLFLHRRLKVDSNFSSHIFLILSVNCEV